MKPIGRMDQQILLESGAEGNTFGEVTTVWTEVETVWAEVKSERGNEAFEAARTNTRETIRVRMHYRDDVETSWRLTWESQVYYINRVDRTMRRQGELWVTASVDGAL